MVVREAATIHLHGEGNVWRLYDEEGVAQGVFRSYPAALTAARYLAKERAPSCVKVRDERGIWKVVERFVPAGSEERAEAEPARRVR